ncbi:related to zinc finger protein [Cephalotrichum gorgonifer]|uniref:Related to zinc finger protein n=1 Tax=Cephalotrichum gorgonifer TaxID=2041049 RepID=A0AAE8MXT5_9PEZI|nr:related to zinc finger protein [Cephalotrichum gorgonifer]
MGKKRRHVDIEEVLGRPWCYYCERDFEDLKLLISHQKAKHFKCDECGRRLNTAGGLSVHMNQVHKETLSQVENALPNRSGLDVEIFGMEGIPLEVLEQHRNRIVQNFYQAQEDRRIATGNPLPGQGKTPRKKVKYETAEEIKARLADWKARKAAERVAAETGVPIPGPPSGPPAPSAYPYPPGQAQYAPPGAPPGAPPPAYPQPGFNGYAQAPLPPRPGEAPPGAAGLPPPPGAYWNNPAAGPPPGPSSTIDELVSGAAAQPGGDDIDQLIRMAEAGVKPAEKPAEEKKSKKEKVRMFYEDTEVSPEERMAQLPRYALVK